MKYARADMDVEEKPTRAMRTCYSKLEFVGQVATNIELDKTVVNLADSPTVIDVAASNSDDLPILKVDSKKNQQVVYPVDFIQIGFKKAFTRSFKGLYKL